MKNIKITFESFLNEELSPETYLSAAGKLQDKGHKNRAKDLRDYSTSIVNKKSADLDSEVSRLQPITITTSGEEFQVKPEYFSFSVFNGEGNIKNDTFGSIQIDWETPTELLKEGEDYIGQHIFFAYDTENNEILDGPLIDGLVIDNRQSANKIVKLLKDIINIKVSDHPQLELVLPYLKANDFYQQN